MNIYFTFDYELFFGENTGSIDNCIIKPTQELIRIADKHKVNFVFFVDAGYIIKLKEYKNKYKSIQNDYNKIIRQLRELDSKGHDIQLHIHPHWEDCSFDGEKWSMNTERFRLHSFTDDEISDIVYKYKKVLTNIIGDKVFAYRAGGWCIQPFYKLRKALKENNIWLDSTVFYKGYNRSETHFYDFRDAPVKDSWRFETDPLIEDKDGFFKELPFSFYKVWPLFFWKHLLTRLFPTDKLRIFGDGNSAKFSKKYLLRLLTRRSYSIVSLDGYKSSFLNKAFKKKLKQNNSENFVVIGHPKGVNSFALNNLEVFIKEYSGKHNIDKLQDN